MNKSHQSSADESDFSLIIGGPLYQFFLRSHLAAPPLALVHRRLIVFPSLTWVPLLLLSLQEGTVFQGSSIPFLHDIVTHARLLVALPLFLIAELFVHERLKPLVEQFKACELIAPADRPRFQAAIASAFRWRNSIWIEILLLVLCFTAGHQVWSKTTLLQSSAWYVSASPEGPHLTRAGMWYAWVSMPVFQFIYARWFYRLFIWARFVWQVSRLPLRLLATHPDRAGGLGFMAESARAFAPVIMAQGAVLAGIMAGKIFFEGASLTSFKLEIAGIPVLQLILFLGPLCLFIKQLAAAKRRGYYEYGTLAMRYVGAFDEKWNRRQAVAAGEMLGSGDIQSLADMGNSYSVIRDMRIVPFDKYTVLEVVFAALLPVAPLILTLIPLDQLITKLLSIPF